MRIVYSVIVEGRSKAHKPEQERRESFSDNERIFLTRNSEAVSAVGHRLNRNRQLFLG